MPFIDKLKSNFEHVVRGTPGRRFKRYHQEANGKRGDESRARAIALLVLGVVLIVGGMLLSIPPGVPGFLVTFLGVGMLVARSRRVARWLDRGEVWLRRRGRDLFHRHGEG